MDATSRKNLENLEKLVKVLRKNGITHYKFADLELKLSDSIPSKPARKPSKKVQVEDSDVEVETLYTEEDALFWSSAGIPDSQSAQ